MLKFSIGNAKVDKGTAIFNLPAGWTCPFAKDCLAKADKLTGKITDGKQARFRCYAASGEALYPNVRKSRWDNLALLCEAKTVKGMADLILASLPKGIPRVRIHPSGDFFSQDYFDAWVLVAQNRKDILFYAYTKALPFWTARIDRIPDNFRLIASYGGTHDHLIGLHYLRNAQVVYSQEQADFLGLDIDHDDILARDGKKSFALLIHNTHPAKSPAMLAVNKLRKAGIGGYR